MSQRYHSPSNDRHKRKHKHRSRSRSPYTRDRKRSHDDRDRRHRQKDDQEEIHIKKEPEDDFKYSGHQGSRSHSRQKPVDKYKNDRTRNEEKRERSHKKRKGVNPFVADAETSGGQEWGSASVKTEKPQEQPSQAKPDFSVSGKLTEDTNSFKGVVINYNEPPEARKPKKRWRLYPFKGDDNLPVLYVHRQSAYLLGRMRKIADIPVDHPSCSKQHAVLQFRLIPFEREDGSKGRKVCPYIIDLNSANGTFVNNKQIEAQRYVQLFEKDVLKFGFSSREYVLLHGGSDTSELQEGEDDLGED